MHHENFTYASNNSNSKSIVTWADNFRDKRTVNYCELLVQAGQNNCVMFICH